MSTFTTMDNPHDAKHGSPLLVFRDQDKRGMYRFYYDVNFFSV